MRSGTTHLPSPLVGEGCEGLASESELSRSWVRGARAEGAQRVSALASARTSRCAPLIQLRLGSATPRQACVSFSHKGRRLGAIALGGARH
jgi:hypothetical protein